MTKNKAVMLILLFALAQTGCTPPDLAKFVRERELCDHLRSELPDPEDREHSAEAVAAVNQQCKGTDGTLETLKRKYADSPSIMDVLSQFELSIEAQ